MVPDPALVRERLDGAGAQAGFRGIMVDRRYDRGGVLLARDEVLRVREYRFDDGRIESSVSWKGPTAVTAEGYKSRQELEYAIQSRVPDLPPWALFDALGFEEIHRIERYVEYYRFSEADIRLEWYPRMDVLIEVEGEHRSIEAALEVIGLPRASYSAEALPVFAERYAARTGTPAALSLEALGSDVPSWEAR